MKKQIKLIIVILLMAVMAIMTFTASASPKYEEWSPYEGNIIQLNNEICDDDCGGGDPGCSDDPTEPTDNTCYDCLPHTYGGWTILGSSFLYNSSSGHHYVRYKVRYCSKCGKENRSEEQYIDPHFFAETSYKVYNKLNNDVHEWKMKKISWCAVCTYEKITYGASHTEAHSFVILRTYYTENAELNHLYEHIDKQCQQCGVLINVINILPLVSSGE